MARSEHDLFVGAVFGRRQRPRRRADREIPRAGARHRHRRQATMCWRSAAAGAASPNSRRARSAAASPASPSAREQHDFAARAHRQGRALRQGRDQAAGLSRRDRQIRPHRLDRDVRGGRRKILAGVLRQGEGLPARPAAPPACRSSPSTRAPIQTYRKRPDFIQRYVFPGGMLPTPAILQIARRRARACRFLRERVFPQDYARTLAEWRERFWASWEKIVPLGFDERFKRLWEFYLHYCEAGFRAEYIDVRQVIYRAWMQRALQWSCRSDHWVATRLLLLETLPPSLHPRHVWQIAEGLAAHGLVARHRRTALAAAAILMLAPGSAMAEAAHRIGAPRLRPPKEPALQRQRQLPAGGAPRVDDHRPRRSPASATLITAVRR